MIFAGIALNFEKVCPIFSSLNPLPSLPFATTRLQISPYFCVLKYARTVKQKVWNEAEKQRARLGRDAKSLLSPHKPYGRVMLARFARVRLLRHALPISLLILRKKKTTVLQSSYNRRQETVSVPLHSLNNKTGPLVFEFNRCEDKF